MIKGVDQINLTDDPEPLYFFSPTFNVETLNDNPSFTGLRRTLHNTHGLPHAEYAPMQEDLTWIEDERVRTKFTNTAVVTRLYQSSDSSQPIGCVPRQCMRTRDERGFDGGCAPHAPPGVNGLLSIVFIGPRRTMAILAMEPPEVWWIELFERFWKRLEVSCPFVLSL